MDYAELYQLGEKERASWKPVRVHCCTASGCIAADSLNVQQSLERAVGDRGLGERVQVVGVGCLGLCGRGPLVETAPSGDLYEKVTPETAPSIVAALTGAAPEAARLDPAHPFFASQAKIVCETSGKIDSERIEEYIAAGGYQALQHVVTDMSPADVVRSVTASGLRGRGGAGYPTGLKWATVAPRRPRRSTSSATATRVILARSWTVALWRAIRIGFSKAWPSPATPSARRRDTSTSAPNIP